MTEVYSKKTRPKTAYRMVFFSALNESRPRTEYGQPMMPLKKGRSSTDYLYDINQCHERPISTPDIYGFGKIKQLKTDEKETMSSARYENLELLVPYQVQIKEDSIDHFSVEQLIKNFEYQIGAKVERSVNSEDYKVVSNIPLFEPKEVSKKPIPTPRPKCDLAKKNSTHEEPLLDEKYNNKFKLKFPPKDSCTTSKVHISEEQQDSHNDLNSLQSNKFIPPYLVVSINETLPEVSQSTISSLKQSSSTDNIYLDPIEARKPDTSIKSNNLNLKYSKSQQKQQKPKIDKRFNKFTRFKTVQQKIFKRSQSMPDIFSGVQEKMDQIVKIPDEDESSLDEDEGWNSDEFDSLSEEEESSVNPQSLDATSRKIYYIVLEILSTERAYVKRLYLLVKIFQDQLLKESRENNMIPEKALGDIFSNLSSIYKFHSDLLLPDLERRLKEWTTNPKIGDIFKTLGHCLVLYTDFVKNFDNSVSTLNYWLKKSPKFATAVELIQMHPQCENLGLQHHMLEPIQRIPRYKLLLQDYIKKLPINSTDYNEAEESLTIISKAAENANSSLRDNDKFKVLLNIQERIVDGLRGESLVTASRAFLKEGVLTKLAARSGTRNVRTILLFSDLLLCCCESTIGKLRVRQIMDLIGLHIVQDDSLPENSFRIQSRQRILDLIANTLEEKEEWVSAIKNAVDDIDNKRGTLICKALENDEGINNDIVGQKAPLWVKDEDVTMCMLCTLKFGLIYRKHHCRGCGKVVCDKCSNYRSVLAYAGNQLQRLCHCCFKKLNPNINLESFPDDKELDLSRQSNAFSDMSGFLFWKAPGKSWSKEWVVLSDYVLYIQKKKQDIKPWFTLPVPGYKVEEVLSIDEIDAPHPHCITLHKENKKELTYYLCSDKKEVINKWKNHLCYAIRLEKLTEKEDV
ncbi:FYVE, RhoGEF and PH domain-containing protein 2 isoform X1 [Hydra vulgaris]